MEDKSPLLTFMRSTDAIDAVALEAISLAVARRDSWLDVVQNSLSNDSLVKLANERDHGYRALQAFITKTKLSPSTKAQVRGALRDWLEDNLSSTYQELLELDDLAFTRAAESAPELIIRVEGAYTAYNLFKAGKERASLLPSHRLRAIQRLQNVHLIHFSHSWQGPYKAALVHGKDQVLRIDFSDRRPLFTIESYRYKASDWSSYMAKADASQFRKFIATTVSPEDLRPLHQLLLKLLPSSGNAA